MVLYLRSDLRENKGYIMPTIENIYKKCTTTPNEKGDTITARTIYNYLISPYIVYCDTYAPEEEKDSIAEFQKMLFEQGQEHEKTPLYLKNQKT